MSVRTVPLIKLSEGKTDIVGYILGANSRTDNSEKHMKFMGVPYHSSDTSPILAMYVNGHSGGNNVRIGGGADQSSAATQISFSTAALTTGAYEGTVRMRIMADGTITIPATATTATGVGLIAHHTNNNMYIRGGTEGLTLVGGSTTESNQGSITIPGGANRMKFETSGRERLRINEWGGIHISDFNVAGLTHLLFSNGYMSMADDATYTFTGSSVGGNANTGALVAIGINRTQQGFVYAHALFFCQYGIAGGSTIIKIADTADRFDVADTDGKMCIYKSSNTSTFTIKNRTEGTRTITVAVMEFQGN